MKKSHLFIVLAVIILFPILIWALGAFPRRSILKEMISVIALIAFSLPIGQFFLSRGGKEIINLPPSKKLLNWHRVIGYLFVSIMLWHPFFIILPRFFEAGVEPQDAFIKMLTTFESKGVILGFIAYALMLIIGLTSAFRKKLPLSFKNWRLLHGLLSLAFLIFALLHATDLGRHMNLSMISFYVVVGVAAIFVLIRTYILKDLKNPTYHE
jgi:predicted ferric reductase